MNGLSLINIPDKDTLEIDSKNINHYKNIDIKNSQSRNRELRKDISGNSFVVYGLESSYYHAMLDNMGQYLYLKDILNNDLKLYITVDYKPGDHIFMNRVLSNLLVELDRESIPYEYLYVNEYSTISFDNIFTVNNYHLTMLDRVFATKNFEQERVTAEKNNDLIKVYSEKVRSLLSKHFIEKQDRKIFVSRGKASQDIADRVHAIFEMRDSGAIEIDDENQSINVIDKAKFNSFPLHQRQLSGSYHADLICRYLPAEEELKIEKFFEDAGYEIINTDQMSLADQVTIWSSATHFATITGSNTVNCIFLNEDCETFIINPNMKYRFFHNVHIEKFIPKPHYIFDYRKHDFSTTKKFSADEIINYIEQTLAENL